MLIEVNRELLLGERGESRPLTEHTHRPTYVNIIYSLVYLVTNNENNDFITTERLANLHSSVGINTTLSTNLLISMDKLFTIVRNQLQLTMLLFLLEYCYFYSILPSTDSSYLTATEK